MFRLALPIAIATTILITGVSQSQARTIRGAAATKIVGTLSSVDYRVAVLARRTSTGSAPTASVSVTTFRKSGAHWVRTASSQLRQTYFWKTISSGRTICNLQLVTASPHPHVTVELLLTPSLGCASATNVPLG
jgi:hypothetical protein